MEGAGANKVLELAATIGGLVILAELIHACVKRGAATFNHLFDRRLDETFPDPGPPEDGQ